MRKWLRWWKLGSNVASVRVLVVCAEKLQEENHFYRGNSCLLTENRFRWFGHLIRQTEPQMRLRHTETGFMDVLPEWNSSKYIFNHWAAGSSYWRYYNGLFSTITANDARYLSMGVHMINISEGWRTRFLWLAFKAWDDWASLSCRKALKNISPLYIHPSTMCTNVSTKCSFVN